MISASSSSTLRAVRTLAVEPLVSFKHHRLWAVSVSQRSYHTETPASEQQPRRPPKPVPAKSKLGPRTGRPLSGSQVKIKVKPGTPKKLLKPYDLSQRLTRLASEGQIDKAIDYLQSLPSDASNVKTWNTLLRLCMMEKRFKLGYTLFTHMKKRGFAPNTRTYTVFLSGLSRIKGWEEYSVQFKNAQALWAGFLQHIEHLKRINPQDVGIEPSPAAFYLMILAANNRYDAIFDVLADLDKEGPFSPTEFVYSKLFQVIAYRPQLDPEDKEKVEYRNASDAKLLWKDLAKRAEKNPNLVSDRTVLYLLKALMKGKPADQLYAFEIVRTYYGLSKPGEEAPQRRIELTPMALEAVLLLCLSTQKYRLCIHYVKQVIDEAIAGDRKCVVDHGHMDRVLQSYAAMTITGSAGESDRAVETIEWMHQYHALGWNVEPMMSTYQWGLMACWRGGDWASAARIAELMTGCHAKDFVDGSPNLSSPRLDDRSQGRMITPDVRALSCLLRAALGSGEVANMRQCLRMGVFFGSLWSSYKTKSMDAYLAQPSGNTTAANREHSFYFVKVAQTLVKVLSRVLEGTDARGDDLERKEWRALSAKAKKVLWGSTKPKAETPDSELQPLGSAEDLEATERFVDYDLATRSRKSS